MEPPHLLLEALDPFLLLGEATTDVLEAFLDLLVGVGDFFVVLLELLRHAAVSLELLTESAGHLLDVAVEIASVLLEATVEFVGIGATRAGAGLLVSGGRRMPVEWVGLPARLRALRTKPTETGLDRIELAEDQLELLGDMGFRRAVEDRRRERHGPELRTGHATLRNSPVRRLGAGGVGQAGVEGTTPPRSRAVSAGTRPITASFRSAVLMLAGGPFPARTPTLPVVRLLKKRNQCADRLIGATIGVSRSRGLVRRSSDRNASEEEGCREEQDAAATERYVHGENFLLQRPIDGLGSRAAGRILGGIMAIPSDLSSAGEETAVLVDFGQGRRLERLAGVLVDRPLPQARLPRRLPGLWADSALTYTGGPEGESRIPAGEQAPLLHRGWRQFRPLPDPWRVTIRLHATTLHLEVRPAASGQTGLFLEQAPQWTWLERVTGRGARILSLFAHSGAATLALAAAGAEVVHVDASRQAIGLARRNADATGLGSAPIRFVCEDARVFVQRELRRGSRYDGVVLDPPSWGHGPKGQAFAIDRDLPLLLDDLAGLVPAPAAGPLLLSCHSSGWTARRLAEALAIVAGKRSREITSGPLTCSDAAGRSLEFGAHARLPPRGSDTPRHQAPP